MKKINEMTEQEILALSEQDVQNMIKFRMMEEGIKVIDKPKKPELFEIEPADQKVYVIPVLDGYAFTDFAEAQLGSNFKYLEKKDRYTYNNEGDFSISEISVYSSKLYANIVDFAAQNKAMQKQVEKDMAEYDNAYAAASDITLEIRNRISEVREKQERLGRLTHSFANDYYPLSGNNEEMAMKFMSKAFTLTGDEEKYILEHYKDINNEK